MKRLPLSFQRYHGSVFQSPGYRNCHFLNIPIWKVRGPQADANSRKTELQRAVRKSSANIGRFIWAIQMLSLVGMHLVPFQSSATGSISIALECQTATTNRHKFGFQGCSPTTCLPVYFKNLTVAGNYSYSTDDGDPSLTSGGSWGWSYSWPSETDYQLDSVTGSATCDVTFDGGFWTHTDGTYSLGDIHAGFPHWDLQYSQSDGFTDTNGFSYCGINYFGGPGSDYAGEPGAYWTVGQYCFTVWDWAYGTYTNQCANSQITETWTSTALGTGTRTKTTTLSNPCEISDLISSSQLQYPDWGFGSPGAGATISPDNYSVSFTKSKYRLKVNFPLGATPIYVTNVVFSQIGTDLPLMESSNVISIHESGYVDFGELQPPIGEGVFSNSTTHVTCANKVGGHRWAEVRIPQSCSGGCVKCKSPGSFDVENGSVQITANLGSDPFDASYGTLLIASQQPSTNVASPRGLEYFGNSRDIELVRIGGALRQVQTPMVLADIVTNSATSYSIKFYRSYGGKDGNGLFTPVGSPFVSGTIEQIDSTNHIRVTVNNGSAVANDYVWSNTEQGWTLSTGNGLRKESKSWNVTGLICTNLIKDAADQIVFREVDYYENLIGINSVVTQRVVGADTWGLKSQTFYYDNPSLDGIKYGLLKMEIEPSGFWKRYEYDANGALTKEISQFLNAPADASENQSRVVEYDYTPTLTGYASVRRIEKLLGTEVARQYTLDNGTSEQRVIRCQTAGTTDLSAADNLITITKFSMDTNYSRVIQSVLNADGTMQMFQRVTNGSLITNIVLSGQPNGSGTDIVDGTKVATVFRSWDGQTYSKTVSDIASLGIITSLETYSQFDMFNRPQRTDYLDGTWSSLSYSCCGIDTATNRDGAVTQYFYDDLKREIASLNLQTGVLASNKFDANNNLLAKLRVGSNQPPIVLDQTAYDIAGQVVKTTNALNGVTSYTNYFDAYGQTVKVTTYPDNGTRVETYFQDGSLKSVTGTAAFPVHYEYGITNDGTPVREYSQEIKLNTNGQDTAESTLTYMDMVGRTYKSVFAAANSPYPYSESVYNNKGQLVKERDPDNVITLYQYNAKGEQEYIALDLNSNGSVDLGTDRVTQTIRNVLFDNNTNVLRTRTFAWNTNGSSTPTLVSMQETAVTGLDSWNSEYPNGSTPVTTVTHIVNSSGGARTVTVTSPDSSYVLSTFSYGRLVSVQRYRSGLGQLSYTTYGYDSQGRQNTIGDARNGTATNYFNDKDQINGTATPPPVVGGASQVTTNYFDNMGRVLKTTLADFTSVTNEYYPTGLLKKTSGSRVYPVEYTYDAQGRVRTMKTWQDFSAEPSAAITTWNYNSYRGWLDNKRYADNSGPDYEYTAGARLKKRTWARVGSVNRISTTYSYGFEGGAPNNHGDLVSVAYANDPQSTPTVTYTYDRRGRQSTVVQNSMTATLFYNNANQLLAESYSGGLLSGFALTNNYDQYMRRMDVAVLSGSSILASNFFGYDAASRLQTAGTKDYTASYSYLANSPLVNQIQFSRGGVPLMTTIKQYDYLNRLTSILSSTNISYSPSVSFNYTYNSANQRTAVTNADSSYWAYSYDSLGQVQSGKRYWSDGTPVAGQQFEYGFDDIGNRKTMSAGGDASGVGLRTAGYANDNLNRILQRSVPGFLSVVGTADSASTVTLWTDPTAGSNVFPGDRVGFSRTSRKGQYFRGELALKNEDGPLWLSITNQAIMNNANNPDLFSTNIGSVFLPQTPETFGYDTDGNLTNDGRFSYTWDAENRLVNIKTRTAVGPPQLIKFEYDARGRRIHKQVWNNTAGTGSPAVDIRFLYDDWNLLAEVGASGSVIRSYLWGLDLSGSLSGAGGIGGLLEMSYYGTQTTNSFVANDGNGNVAALLAENGYHGSWAAQNEYGAFGELIRATGPMVKVNPIRFSTRYQDEETDLIYYGYRYYNPSTGRWMNRDPLEENGGWNLYEFVGNLPINSFDSHGLICECAKQITFQNIKKVNFHDGVDVFGHSFDVAIDLDYIHGDGLATFEWLEKTDVVPIYYVGRVKPNEWGDIHALFQDLGIFTFKWDSRDTKSEGKRSVVEHDQPQMGILSFRPVKRTLEFDLIVNNPPCCSCDDKSRYKSRIHVTAKQELSTISINEHEPTKIKTQEFVTPYGTIQ
jgi:RHS repeat-associated protein